MLKQLSILIVVILLASCIRVEYKRTLADSFIGMKEQELVTRIGPPDNVYAIGDVRQKRLRQIVTACSDGAIASVDIIDYISKKSKIHIQRAKI